jgi:hypothetical protein
VDEDNGSGGEGGGGLVDPKELSIIKKNSIKIFVTTIFE